MNQKQYKKVYILKKKKINTKTCHKKNKKIKEYQRKTYQYKKRNIPK